MPYTKGNEFFTILKALGTMTTQTISFLTTDMETWQIIGVGRDTMEEALKSF